MTLEGKLGGVLAVAALVWRLGFASPAVDVELWEAVTYSGAAFLGIGLVRDIVIKLTKRTGAPQRSGEKLICFESLTGALLVASGLGLFGVDAKCTFHPVAASVALWGALLLVLSGETKDVVLVFKKEKD